MKKFIMLICLVTFSQHSNAGNFPGCGYLPGDKCTFSTVQQENELSYVLVACGLEVDARYLAEWAKKQLENKRSVNAVQQQEVKDMSVQEKQEPRCTSPFKTVAAAARALSPTAVGALKEMFKSTV